ncbi:MAG: ImuA family protein [Sphingomonadaceae bacterium]
MIEPIRLADALPMRLRLAAQMDNAGGCRFMLGAPAVDARLGGGIERAAFHEIFAREPGDASGASAFAAMLAMRGCAASKPVLWVRASARAPLHAWGLAELGIDPSGVLLVAAPDTLSAVRAGSDIVACSGVGAVVIEIEGRAPVLDLTATRRLSLAAARSGVLALLLRNGAEPVPSAARTRWSVAGAPSLRLAGNAPGHPAFDIALVRNRYGLAGFEARVEWNRDEQSFRDAPLSGAAPAVPGFGTGAALDNRAAA